jgi:hypothetical protein
LEVAALSRSPGIGARRKNDSRRWIFGPLAVGFRSSREDEHGDEVDREGAEREREEDRASIRGSELGTEESEKCRRTKGVKGIDGRRG